MKKLLGLFALTLAASSLTVASNAKEQDFFENINWKSEYRKYYVDDKNEIGNPGLGKEDNTENQWRNYLSGTLNMKDLGGMKLNFSLYQKQIFAGEESFGKFGKELERDTWETDFNLVKSSKSGKVDYTLLGWYRSEDGAEANVLYMGPSFGMKFLGQDIKVKTHAVYFRDNGNTDTDYYLGNKEGYGANVDLSFGKTATGKLGSLGYDISLANHWRKATADRNGLGQKANNWNLDHEYTVTYQTPSFWNGFYSGVELYDEWIRNTAGGRNSEAGKSWSNEFAVTPFVGYKTSVNTAVGKLSINPYVKYQAYQRYTEKNGVSDNDRETAEQDILKMGVSFGLSID